MAAAITGSMKKSHQKRNQRLLATGKIQRPRSAGRQPSRDAVRAAERGLGSLARNLIEESHKPSFQMPEPATAQQRKSGAYQQEEPAPPPRAIASFSEGRLRYGSAVWNNFDSLNILMKLV